MKQNESEKFGELLIRNFFGKGIERFNNLSKNNLKSPSTQQHISDLQKLNPDQVSTIKNMVFELMTRAMHDFLFAIQERNDINRDIAIIVDNKNIAEKSDGLHGELFTRRMD